jgi:hypothetical protein
MSNPNKNATLTSFAQQKNKKLKKFFKLCGFSGKKYVQFFNDYNGQLD